MKIMIRIRLSFLPIILIVLTSSFFFSASGRPPDFSSPQTVEAGVNFQQADEDNPDRSPDRTQRKATLQAITRMNRDKEKYSGAEIMDAERMYQIANKRFGSAEAKDSLESMLKKYPDMNRTGCAMLYLAQMTSGEEREKWLQEAIDHHSDCMYGDGSQVGALARMQLGYIYKDQGDMKKATALFQEIRSGFADAVDHKGRLIISIIPAQ